MVGDSYLGEPLFYAGLISGVWLMLRRTAARIGPVIEEPEPATENAPVTLTGDIRA